MRGLDGSGSSTKSRTRRHRSRRRRRGTRAGDAVGLFDRVFLDTEPEALLHVGTGAAVAVENTAGWTDTVVWNPHETLPGGCWKNFVCVESAAVSKTVTLEPEEVWRAETNLSVVDV